jgi:hypothetical protein
MGGEARRCLADLGSDRVTVAPAAARRLRRRLRGDRILKEGPRERCERILRAGRSKSGSEQIVEPRAADHLGDRRAEAAVVVVFCDHLAAGQRVGALRRVYGAVSVQHPAGEASEALKPLGIAVEGAERGAHRRRREQRAQRAIRQLLAFLLPHDQSVELRRLVGGPLEGAGEPVRDVDRLDGARQEPPADLFVEHTVE